MDPEESPQGRTASFTDGAGEATPSVTHALYANAGGPYKPKSVFDQITGSGIGYSAQDRSRMLLGGSMLPTGNGASDTTYQKSSMLASPYRPLPSA